jgi:glycosyltransferase involved in cell wall biosynthesis
MSPPAATLQSPRPGLSRILLLIDDLDCGGAQQMVVSFALELQRRGLHCLVCALHPGVSLGSRLEGSGVRFFSLDQPRPSIMSPARFGRYVLGCLTALRTCIRREGIEVVHAHLSDAEFLGLLAGRLCGVARVVVTVHSQRPLPERRAFDPRTGLRVWLTRLLFNRADAVVAVSEETAAILRDVFGVRPDRLRVIINGIDTAAAQLASGNGAFAGLPIPRGRPVLCSVGRLAAQKNHAVLIPVLRRLLDQGLDPVLVLAGDGELRPALEVARDAAGLTDRMLFLGQRDDVAAIIAASDIFVLPSFYEGTSLALLEAMAAGKPIVASDVPGNRDVLRPGETALLCPPEAPDALAEAIARLVDQPELAAALGAAARAEAREKYDIAGMTDAYLALWNAPGR